MPSIAIFYPQVGPATAATSAMTSATTEHKSCRPDFFEDRVGISAPKNRPDSTHTELPRIQESRAEFELKNEREENKP